MNLIMEMDELSFECPVKLWDLSIPIVTRRRLCAHTGIERRTSSYCVIDYYCASCGEWLLDKDVS